MRRFGVGLLLVALLAAAPLLLHRSTPLGGEVPLPHQVEFGKLPLAFEANGGQADPAARFLTRAAGGTFFFTPTEVVLVSGGPQPQAVVPGSHMAAPAAPNVMRLRLLETNPTTSLGAGERLPGRVNYLHGNDPARWQTGLPTYAGITYQAVYAGIDLHYSGAGGQLKSTYTVAPGADPAQIRWRYDGASSVTVDEDGNLQIGLTDGAGTLTEQAPVAWQVIQGAQVMVPARYTVADDHSVGFMLGAYDRAQTLIIDPTLVYSSYLGGSLNDTGTDTATDAAGNIYLTGQTFSPNFPLLNPYQSTYRGAGDVFVAKLDPTGATLLYATYLGGSGDDVGLGVAVDSSNNIAVAGFTNSANFPLVNPIQPLYGGGYDGFITKLTSTGVALSYSTYLGGNANDWITDATVGSSGEVYVVGETMSNNFPTVNAYQPTVRGYGDAFIARVATTGATLIYSTLLGGSDYEGIYSIAVDSNGYAYLSGYTHSFDFPTLNPIQPSYGGGFGDTFVTKLAPSGSALAYSTYLGGSLDDVGFGMAIDAAGAAYHFGYTNSSNYPVLNPIQPTNHGGYDLFVTKLNPGGAGLAYSTYLGGSLDERGAVPSYFGLAVNGAGEVYLGANSRSVNFPLVNPIQAIHAGGQDAVIAKLNAAGSALLYSTYLGGAGDDNAWDITLPAPGIVNVVGSTQSSNFPVVSPYQPANAGATDAFIARISDAGPTATATRTATPTPTRTATNPPTATATPKAINTPTGTSTPVPPTSTPVPPTSTPTPQPTTCAQQTPTRIPTPAWTPAPGCSPTPRSGDLRAVITDHPGTTDATFTNRSSTCSYRIGLAVYRKLDANIDHQELYDYRLAVIPPNSTLVLTANNPPCAYQGDAFWGDILYSFANGARYGVRRLDDTDGHGTNYCLPACPPTPSPSPTPPAQSCGSLVATVQTCRATPGCADYMIPLRNITDQIIRVSGTVALQRQDGTVLQQVKLPPTTLTPGGIITIQGRICLLQGGREEPARVVVTIQDQAGICAPQKWVVPLLTGCTANQ